MVPVNTPERIVKHREEALILSDRRCGKSTASVRKQLWHLAKEESHRMPMGRVKAKESQAKERVSLKKTLRQLLSH